jgi:hypothetical protein
MAPSPDLWNGRIPSTPAACSWEVTGIQNTTLRFTENPAAFYKTGKAERCRPHARILKFILPLGLPLGGFLFGRYGRFGALGGCVPGTPKILGMVKAIQTNKNNPASRKIKK